MEALKARAAQGCPHARAQLEEIEEKAKGWFFSNLPYSLVISIESHLYLKLSLDPL